MPELAHLVHAHADGPHGLATRLRRGSGLAPLHLRPLQLDGPRPLVPARELAVRDLRQRLPITLDLLAIDVGIVKPTVGVARHGAHAPTSGPRGGGEPLQTGHGHIVTKIHLGRAVLGIGNGRELLADDAAALLDIGNAPGLLTLHREAGLPIAAPVQGIPAVASVLVGLPEVHHHGPSPLGGVGHRRGVPAGDGLAARRTVGECLVCLAAHVKRGGARHRAIHGEPGLALIIDGAREGDLPRAGGDRVGHAGHVATDVGLAVPAGAALLLVVAHRALTGVVVDQIAACSRLARIRRAVRGVPAEPLAVLPRPLLEPALALAVVVLVVVARRVRVVDAGPVRAAGDAERGAVVDVHAHGRAGERRVTRVKQLQQPRLRRSTSTWRAAGRRAAGRGAAGWAARWAAGCRWRLASHHSRHVALRQPSQGVPRIAGHRDRLGVHQIPGGGQLGVGRRSQRTAGDRLAGPPLREVPRGLTGPREGPGAVGEPVRRISLVARVGGRVGVPHVGAGDRGEIHGRRSAAVHRQALASRRECPGRLTDHTVLLRSTGLSVQGVSGVAGVGQLVLEDGRRLGAFAPGLMDSHRRGPAGHALAGPQGRVAPISLAGNRELLHLGVPGVAVGGPSLGALVGHHLREYPGGAAAILAANLTGLRDGRNRRAVHRLALAPAGRLALDRTVGLAGHLEGAGPTSLPIQSVAGLAAVPDVPHSALEHNLSLRRVVHSVGLRRRCAAIHGLAGAVPGREDAGVHAGHSEPAGAHGIAIQRIAVVAGVLDLCPEPPFGGGRLDRGHLRVLVRAVELVGGVGRRLRGATNHGRTSHVAAVGLRHLSEAAIAVASVVVHKIDAQTVVRARVSQRAVVDVPAPLLPVLVQPRLVAAVAIADVVVVGLVSGGREVPARAVGAAVVHQAIIDVNQRGRRGELSVRQARDLEHSGGALVRVVGDGRGVPHVRSVEHDLTEARHPALGVGSAGDLGVRNLLRVAAADRDALGRIGDLLGAILLLEGAPESAGQSDGGRTGHLTVHGVARGASVHRLLRIHEAGLLHLAVLDVRRHSTLNRLAGTKCAGESATVGALAAELGVVRHVSGRSIQGVALQARVGHSGGISYQVRRVVGQRSSHLAVGSGRRGSADHGAASRRRGELPGCSASRLHLLGSARDRVGGVSLHALVLGHVRVVQVRGAGLSRGLGAVLRGHVLQDAAHDHDVLLAAGLGQHGSSSAEHRQAGHRRRQLSSGLAGLAEGAVALGNPINGVAELALELHGVGEVHIRRRVAGVRLVGRRAAVLRDARGGPRPGGPGIHQTIAKLFAPQVVLADLVSRDALHVAVGVGCGVSPSTGLCGVGDRRRGAVADLGGQIVTIVHLVNRSQLLASTDFVGVPLARKIAEPIGCCALVVVVRTPALPPVHQSEELGEGDLLAEIVAHLDCHGLLVPLGNHFVIPRPGMLCLISVASDAEMACAGSQLIRHERQLRGLGVRGIRSNLLTEWVQLVGGFGLRLRLRVAQGQRGGVQCCCLVVQRIGSQHSGMGGRDLQHAAHGINIASPRGSSAKKLGAVKKHATASAVVRK
mmetsp:Transcript_8337/g.20574  ORF Transcript_8337/g.20574 Transcript_8337/m.20574 type:complete len:1561 (+) Transcript_8337:7342-12024(+)